MLMDRCKGANKAFIQEYLMENTSDWRKGSLDIENDMGESYGVQYRKAKKKGGKMKNTQEWILINS